MSLIKHLQNGRHTTKYGSTTVSWCFLAFRRTVVPPSSRFKQSKNTSCRWMSGFRRFQGTTILRNVTTQENRVLKLQIVGTGRRRSGGDVKWGGGLVMNVTCEVRRGRHCVSHALRVSCTAVVKCRGEGSLKRRCVTGIWRWTEGKRVVTRITEITLLYTNFTQHQ